MSDELVTMQAESVEGSILLIRNQKVILDRTLAKLYGVSTKILNQAVKRNPERFPPDFMFQLTMDEAMAVDPTKRESLRSQIVTLNSVTESTQNTGFTDLWSRPPTLQDHKL